MADAKVKIVRYLTSRTVDDNALVRRQQLDAELGRVTKLFRWEHIAEGGYLTERRRITAAMDELPPDLSSRDVPSDQDAFPASRFPERAVRRAVDRDGARRRSSKGRAFVHRSSIRLLVQPPSSRWSVAKDEC